MEKINIAVRKLVEILLEDTEFVIERLPKSTMFGKTEEENREHIYIYILSLRSTMTSMLKRMKLNIFHSRLVEFLVLQIRNWLFS